MAKKSTYRYFLPEQGMSADDPYEFQTQWGDDEPRWIAEDAADDYWSEHDGWEASWPQTITVILSDDSQHTFTVEMEAQPAFFARTPRPSQGKTASEVTK